MKIYEIYFEGEMINEEKLYKLRVTKESEEKETRRGK